MLSFGEPPRSRRGGGRVVSAAGSRPAPRSAGPWRKAGKHVSVQDGRAAALASRKRDRRTEWPLVLGRGREAADFLDVGRRVLEGPADLPGGKVGKGSGRRPQHGRGRGPGKHGELGRRRKGRVQREDAATLARARRPRWPRRDRALSGGAVAGS